MAVQLLKHPLTQIPYKAALEYIGGLSRPSKMPCPSYSLPIWACRTGSTLREVEGSVCYRCYAGKGNYSWPNVQRAMERRLESLKNLPLWIDSMVSVLSGEGNDYFRWHDSGDLQSMQHLHAIVRIAQLMPSIRFWLPTKEYKLVEAFTSAHDVPDNLTIRVSAPMQGLSYVNSRKYKNISLVASLDDKDIKAQIEKYDMFACPSINQDHKCGRCRACWDKNNKFIVYQRI